METVGRYRTYNIIISPYRFCKQRGGYNIEGSAF